MSDNFFDQEQNSEIELAVSKNLTKLIDEICSITEFKSYTLKAISILSTDRFFMSYLELMLSNLKHIKRKHADELLTAFKYLSNYIKPKESSGFLGNIFNRKKEM